jgi:hypothetical protein
MAMTRHAVEIRILFAVVAIDMAALTARLVLGI